MSVELNCDSVVVATSDQVSCDLSGEAAILNLKNGLYYGLDPVGARAWNLFQQPRSVRDVRDQLLQEFEVDALRCETDLIALLKKMHAEGLIEIRNAASASAQGSST